MLESHSALESVVPYYGTGLTISEASDFTLTQYAGNEKQLKKALGKIPVRVGISLEHESRTLIRISPSQIWLIGEPLKTEACCTTPLSSSRTRIALDGENARAILAKLAAIDFHRKKFKLGMFAQTAIHHTPALIHCANENTFHIYAMRTFALSVWEMVADASLEFAK